jgi:protease I
MRFAGCAFLSLILLVLFITVTGCSTNISSNINSNNNINSNMTQQTNQNQQNAQGENMKKIAMIIAPKGYQTIEFSVPYDYFKSHGAIVDVYSTKKGTAFGSIGGTFNVEHTLDELKASNYDAVVFVGGPGTPIVRSDNNSVNIAKSAVKNNKILGAICWSPTILAKGGLLSGKNATVWYGEDDELGMMTSEYLEQQGARYTAQDLTVDGNIITANGPPAAQKYAEAIWKKLNP